MILLHYLQVLHYREFFTLLEQNSIIYIFQDFPLFFYGGHFENRYPNPTEHNKWILARSNNLNFFLLHYWLNLLHYREVLHYWLNVLHYREVLHYGEFFTLLELNIIIDVF